MRLYRLEDRSEEIKENGICKIKGPFRGDGLHVYVHPLIAAFANPVTKEVLWECDGKEKAHTGFTIICSKIKYIRRISLPKLTKKQRRRTGAKIMLYLLSKLDLSLRCSYYQRNMEKWIKWAHSYLSNKDVSEKSFEAACVFASNASQAAYMSPNIAYVASNLRWVHNCNMSVNWITYVAENKVLFANEIIKILEEEVSESRKDERDWR